MISLDFVVGCTVAAVFVLVGVGAIVLGRRHANRADAYDPFDGHMVFWGGVACLVLTVVITAVALFPYDMQYHSYRHVEGSVDAVQARMIGDGDGGTTQMFAVRFSGDGTAYRCDDSRCSLLKPGNHLSLWCIREWQYASTSGWVCRFHRSSGT